MKFVAEYRKLADEYRKLADKLARRKDKHALELMARAWDSAAARNLPALTCSIVVRIVSNNARRR